MAARRLEAVLRGLGLRIQEIRRAQGFTQQTFADRIRMLVPNYARIEQGRANVTIDTLLRIADVLDVELVELFRTPARKRSRPGRPRHDEQ